ncbi:MAG: ABC transporter permease [Propionibacteriaceae bacterium]|jgi:multidrug/hemolysin transport system permease protein|nr:ABC transporter permease [Propionibacteriaceae bacterium]
MTAALVLLGRHLRIFGREPITVFFSILSPLVLFLLFILFFRENTAGSIAELIPLAPKDDAYALCDAWMFSSVVTLATFSSSLGLLTAFVEDRVSGRFGDCLITPVRRWQLAISYVACSFVVSFTISALFGGLGQVWAAAVGQPLMSVPAFGRMLGATAVCCLFYAAFNTLIVTFTSTPGSFSGYSVVMGTAMGFLTYCYVPPSTLSQGIRRVLELMPFAQGAAAVREPVMTPAIEQLARSVPPEGQDQVRRQLLDDLGAHLQVGGHDLTSTLIVVILAGLTVPLAILIAWRMNKVIR